MARAIDDSGDADERFSAGGMDERTDTAAIRADIRETRERMSQTLDGIGERLNPQVLKQQAQEHIQEVTQQVKHNIREATIGRAEHMARNAAGRVTETRRGIADAIRDNPIPAAMVGIGLGWLLYSGRRSDSYGETEMIYQPRADGFTPQSDAAGMYNQPGRVERATEWAGDATSGVRDRATDLTERAQETVSGIAGRTTEVLGDTASRARSAAGNIAQQTRSQADRLENRFHDAIVESPLVVGAAAIALGLTAGMAIPSTRRESELMGAQRDQLFDRARGMAEETSGRVQQVAQRVVQEAQSSAQEAIQTLQSTVKDAAHDLQSTAREAAQEQGFMGSDGASSTSPHTGSGQNTGSQTGAFGASGTGTGTSQSPVTQPGTTGTGTGTGTGPGAFSTGSEGGSIADPRRM